MISFRITKCYGHFLQGYGIKWCCSLFFEAATDCSSYFHLGVKGVTFQKCEYTTLCYAPSWLCDGANDCGDFSDERNCPGILDTYFLKCNKSEIIFPQMDQSKKSNLDYSKWNKNNKCFHPLNCGLWRILLENYCSVNSVFYFFPHAGLTPSCFFSDFSVALPGSGKTKCPTPFFACPSGRCIPMSWTCDKENDCENGADEAHCGKLRYKSPNKLNCDGPLLCFGACILNFIHSFWTSQINSAQPLSLSVGTTAAFPTAGCVTEPTTVGTAVMRTASAVSIQKT